MRPLLLASFCAAAILAACQSIEVEMNKPLTGVAPADSPTISKGGYRITALPVPEHDDILLILAFSGGGKRSSAFSFRAISSRPA